MDQIWETLMKFSSSVNKLQKTQVASQAKRHSNFVDIEKLMKNLENSSGTTPLNSNPRFRLWEHKYYNLEGKPIVSTATPTPVDIVDLSRDRRAMSKSPTSPLEVGFESHKTSLP